MVPNWHDFTVESFWSPSDALGGCFYRLTLTNGSQTALRGFKLGFSGPAAVFEGSSVENGSIVTRLSNYCELAPPSGFALEPGAQWTVTIRDIPFPFRHWTDGAVNAFVIIDGKAVVARTLPTRSATSTVPLKSGVMSLAVSEEQVGALSVVPWPNRVETFGNRTAPDGLNVSADDEPGAAALAVFTDLAERLFAGEGLVRNAGQGGYEVMLKTSADLGAEAYRLAFTPDAVRLEAATQTGFLYGLVTLAQIARGARHERQRFAFPTGGIIEDAPAMGWRGCHFDVARRFFAKEEVKHFLRTMAWNKFNVFHWHLSEDEAWRVEIDAFPELTGKGAWRGYGLAIPPLLGSGPEPHGGFYTKDEVREIVAFAAGLGIEVVPEIDVPGHSYALITAIPRLKDPGENGIYQSVQWFPNNSLNPAVEASYEVLETIFDELIALFPSRYFHVGADEVPHEAWATSPKAQALLKEIGGQGAASLQAHFLRRIQAMLTARGKITGAWEEAAMGGGIDKADCYLVGWRAVAASLELAREGYDVVVAPGQAYYLDMANGPDWHEPGASWAGWSSPEMTYRFDPVAGWGEADRARLRGVQGCIWCEPMTDRAVFDRLVYPRLSAIAETGWTRPEHKDWPRFAGAAHLMPSLYGVRED